MTIRPVVASPYQTIPTPVRAGREAPLDSVVLGATPETADESPRKGVWAAVVLGLATAASVLAPGPVAAATGATVSQSATTSLESRISGNGLTDARARVVRSALSALPASVRAALEANGLRIVVLGPQADLVALGIVTPVDVAREYADPSALRARAEAAMAPVERLFAPRVAAGEARMAEAVGEEAFFEARMETEMAEEQRDMWARRAAHEATEGRVEPVAGDSLDAIARMHGAETPEQVQELTSLIRQLNPDLTTDRLLVPAFHYVDGVRLSTHDRVSVEAWREDGARGQYHYAGSRNTLLLQGETLDAPDGGHVVLHELGHAYEDAVLERDPVRHARFRPRRDAAYLRMQDAGTLRNDHPGSSPSELVAESFADLLEGRRLSGEWGRAMRDLVGPVTSRPLPGPRVDPRMQR